jgi:hypothetical protein
MTLSPDEPRGGADAQRLREVAALDDQQREIRERVEATKLAMMIAEQPGDIVRDERRRSADAVDTAIEGSERRLRILAASGDAWARSKLEGMGVDLAHEQPRGLASVQLTIDDARTPPREEFAIGSMIPFTKSSVLFGPQSVGKSALAAQLAFAFAAGAETLWGLPLYRGGGAVLIYTAEDSLDDWKRKAAALMCAGGIDVRSAMERIYIIDKSDGVARLSEVVTMRFADTTRRVAQPTDEQDRMIAAVRAVEARLILVETASRLVEDEDNANMSALQSALGRIARETGAAVLCTHHPTKAASKENDSAIESARGGGAFTMNARNVVSVFPADAEAAKQYAGRFPADDLVVLAHGKPSSSTRRQSPIVLVRCDAVFGAVFQLPDRVAFSPEQEQANVERVEREREREADHLRRLYAEVEKLLPLGLVSPSRLRDRVTAIGVTKRKLDDLIKLALDQCVLKVVARPGGGRGVALGLGRDPRKPTNDSRGIASESDETGPYFLQE